MQDDRRNNGALRWAALAVPGIFAGISWAGTEGWPLWNRILAGIAAALVVYAAIHLLLKGVKGNGR